MHAERNAYGDVLRERIESIRTELLAPFAPTDDVPGCIEDAAEELSELASEVRAPCPHKGSADERTRIHAYVKRYGRLGYDADHLDRFLRGEFEIEDV